MKQALKSNFIYLIGSLANGAALFLLLPYFITSLSPLEFGVWSVFEVVLVFLNIVVLAGLDVYMMRNYWAVDDKQEQKRMIGALFIILTVWGSFCSLIVVIVGSLLPAVGVLSEVGLTPFVLSGAIGLFDAIFTFLLSIFRIQEKSLYYAILSLGRMLLFIGVSIFFVHSGNGINGALAGRLVAGIVFTLIACIFASHSFHLRFDKKYLTGWVGYGLPMIPAGIIFYVLIASDRYFLEALTGLQSVAVYSFAYKIATLPDYLINRPFSTDWAARRFQISAEANPQRKFADLTLIFAFASIWIALLAQCVTLLLYKWFAPVLYFPGLNIIPVLLAANVLMGLSLPLNVGIMIKDRTNTLPYITAVAGAVYIFLLWQLIPSYEIMGAAWATFFAYLVYTAGIAWVSVRLYPIKYHIWSWATLGIGFILAQFSIMEINSWNDISVIIKVGFQVLSVSFVFCLVGLFLLRQKNYYLPPFFS